MGLDLSLLPCVYPNNFDLSMDVLTLHRDDALFELIKKLADKSGFDVLRSGLNCYCATLENGETGYGIATEDKYGEKLRSVTANQLATCMEVYIETTEKEKGRSSRNSAVMNYLKNCPIELPVYLFWN